MLRVLATDLWPTISRLAAEPRPKQAAVAYVTSDTEIAFGKGDVLVVDASDASIRAGRTAAAVLRAAFDRGVSLFSLENLHAKIVCLDPFVIVGSANVSRASVQTLVEAAMVTDHPAGLAEARALISRLQEHATRIDERFLKRIEALPVERAAPVRGRRIALEPDRPARAWLVGLHAIDEHPDEAALVEKGEEEAVRVRGEGDETISWLRFTGTSRFRRDAARGDTVLQIWRESRKAKDGSVFFPVPILHRQDEPTCARFFVPEPDRPVRPPLAWRRFLTLWSDVNGGTPPSLSTARLLTDEVAERLIAAWPTKRA